MYVFVYIYIHIVCVHIYIYITSKGSPRDAVMLIPRSSHRDFREQPAQQHVCRGCCNELRGSMSASVPGSLLCLGHDRGILQLLPTAL